MPSEETRRVYEEARRVYLDRYWELRLLGDFRGAWEVEESYYRRFPKEAQQGYLEQIDRAKESRDANDG